MKFWKFDQSKTKKAYLSLQWSIKSSTLHIMVMIIRKWWNTVCFAPVSIDTFKQINRITVKMPRGKISPFLQGPLDKGFVKGLWKCAVMFFTVYWDLICLLSIQVVDKHTRWQNTPSRSRQKGSSVCNITYVYPDMTKNDQSTTELVGGEKNSR